MVLTYRKEEPDVPGFWWVIDGCDVEQIVEVVSYPERGRDPRLVAFEPGVNGFVELSYLRAVGWAGPVPRPGRQP